MRRRLRPWSDPGGRNRGPYRGSSGLCRAFDPVRFDYRGERRLHWRRYRGSSGLLRAFERVWKLPRAVGPSARQSRLGGVPPLGDLREFNGWKGSGRMAQRAGRGAALGLTRPHHSSCAGSVGGRNPRGLPCSGSAASAFGISRPASLDSRRSHRFASGSRRSPGERPIPKKIQLDHAGIRCLNERSFVANRINPRAPYAIPPDPCKRYP